MPTTAVRFYREADGATPVRDWLMELIRRDKKAAANCVAAIHRLAALGHELRRPQADYLREGIYELRVKRGRVNYCILYFFHGRNVALLSHALTKEGKVPEVDIERALRRKQRYENNPRLHTAEETIDNTQND
jgi:phage-related protein